MSTAVRASAPVPVPAAGTASFVAITPHRAFEDIAGQIRALVADGRLKPGDRLPPERELAAQFHVSRNTLREALRALELAGMIESRKGAAGGAFVRPGSGKVVVGGLRDLYHLGAITPEHLTEARIWLSTLVVRVACERATEEDLAALEANVAAAMRADEAGDFDERQRLHREFHLILAQATRNPIVAITMEGVMEVLGHFIARIGPRENPFTLPSRRRFLKHLRARDAEAAAAEMTRFLERMQQGYLAQWKDQAPRA
ncbi:MAG: FadR family transcriptional regulator [Rubrivivax sp.]|nr:FadR family transcriptional regulator [Rubrivivax sp.]